MVALLKVHREHNFSQGTSLVFLKLLLYSYTQSSVCLSPCQLTCLSLPPCVICCPLRSCVCVNLPITAAPLVNLPITATHPTRSSPLRCQLPMCSHSYLVFIPVSSSSFHPPSRLLFPFGFLLSLLSPPTSAQTDSPNCSQAAMVNSHLLSLYFPPPTPTAL